MPTPQLVSVAIGATPAKPMFVDTGATVEQIMALLRLDPNDFICRVSGNEVKNNYVTKYSDVITLERFFPIKTISGTTPADVLATLKQLSIGSIFWMPIGGLCFGGGKYHIFAIARSHSGTSVAKNDVSVEEILSSGIQPVSSSGRMSTNMSTS